MVILNNDYFSIPADDVRDIHSLLTIVNGKVVYAEAAYKKLAPEMPAVIPAWSPVKFYGGYQITNQ